MVVGLRPVEEADQPFLLSVYAGTREQELALVPWTEEQKTAFVTQQFAAQSEHYARYFTGVTAHVILFDGEPAGRLMVARWASEIRIVDIALLPAFRGRGVGTRLVTRLQEEAAAAGKPLSIHVERFNPAITLYRRLGFAEIEDKEVYLLMEWRATG